ncbi:hypothetical protein BZA77DRAFT_266281 [Pyronema omphalodes]|nr:hypothetical protein BZA77DRAFT_266281 [Pyronema omphalodes]
MASDAPAVETTIEATQPAPAPGEKDTRPKQWADGPFPLIATPRFSGEDKSCPFTTAASHMALVHNILLRTLNSIYLQAPRVPATEHLDFIQYSLLWSALIHAHHHGEEAQFFPGVEEAAGVPGLMTGNVDQHHLFTPGIKAYESYLQSCITTPGGFSGDKLCEIIDGFATTLQQHLADEIQTILKLREYGDKIPILKLIEEEGKKVMGEIPKTSVLMLLTVNLEKNFEGGIHNDFPPAPGMVRLLMRFVWPIPKRKWWKFASCGWDGKRRELKYAPLVEA